VAGDVEQHGGQERGSAEAAGEEEGKGGGNPPQCRIRAAPTRAVVVTGSDRHQRALCHEHGHHAMSGSMVSDVGAVTGPSQSNTFSNF
jgi:hypothetical protein